MIVNGLADILNFPRSMADTHYRCILMKELVFRVDFKMILHKVSKGLSEVKNLFKYFLKVLNNSSPITVCFEIFKSDL